LSAAQSFPPGFLWGTAISAHQTEGNNIHSDWWAWEQGPRLTGREPSGRAANHWELYQSDFRLARDLGFNAQRISLEWARIEPAPDAWSSEALGHYRAVLEFLKQLGFTTFVTLHHFTNPLWLARWGGWETPAVVEHFVRYVEHVTRELGDLVDLWNPINEPTVYATYAYLIPLWPPQKSSLVGAWRVFRHMVQAHRAAYRTIHTIWPNAYVGTAHHMAAGEPARDHWLDRAAVGVGQWLYNDWFLEAVRTALDFVGINYYFRKRLRVRARAWRRAFCEELPAECPQTDLGWEIYPPGIYQQLVRAKPFRLPVYVTENGLADAADTQRAEFIRAHLAQVHRAIAEGVDVRGYFHWSLIDNYEWHHGFTPRFGLVEVDYGTFERRPRPSAYVYGTIARGNALTPSE
jgi:beta-glucosidase